MGTTTLSSLTLNPTASFPELYEPLWLYSGSSSSAAGSSAGLYGLGKGTSGNSSVVALFTLNSNSPANQKYAFECSLQSSGATYYAELWDITSNAGVLGSQISTSSSTMTVLRSGQFTLTSGHSYGVTVWSTTISKCTDASLIVFPSASLQSPSLSSLSLIGGQSLKEAYIPLWMYSSGTASISGPTGYLQKGSTATVTSLSSATSLYNLSSAWSASQKFAFETSIYNGTSGDTAYATVWDQTANAEVTSARISTTANSATLIRSGQFTLIPGHSYGVNIWASTGTTYISKAHLVALGA